MTRDEAIEHIIGLQESFSGEHSVSQHETDADRAEVVSALNALGVSAIEIELVTAEGGSE